MTSGQVEVELPVSGTARKKKAKERSGSRKLIHRIQYGAFRIASAVVQRTPMTFSYPVARCLGLIAYFVDVRHRPVTLRNLDIAFSEELTPREKRRIARQAFQSLAQLPLDVMLIPKLLRRDRIEKYIRLVNLDRLDEASLRSKVAIYVTAHHGSWEITPIAISMRGHRFHSVARPMGNPYINDYLIRSREALGQKIVTKYGALSELIRHLRDGGSLGFVADQDARRHGIFVDFFGEKASTIPSPALLAVKFKAPVIVGHCERVGGRFQFDVVADEVLWPDESLPRTEAVHRLTQKISHCMESFIRRNPGQYLWLHRRWKTRPEGMEGVYR